MLTHSDGSKELTEVERVDIGNLISILARERIDNPEKGAAGQPATRPESKLEGVQKPATAPESEPEGNKNPKPEAEVCPQ